MPSGIKAFPDYRKHKLTNWTKIAMEFSVSCATFARLSNACRWMIDGEDRAYLRALYVERSKGKLIAVATNSKIAAIELLDEKCTGPDEYCFVAFDPVLVAQCRQESAWQSHLQIASNNDLQWTTAKTMFGYVHPTNVGIYPNNAVETGNWRDWFPDIVPNEPYGTMQIVPHLMADLGLSAPSGEMFFPHFIDTRRPVMVRDQISPNWYGLFMPDFGQNKPAPKFSIPKW